MAHTGGRYSSLPTADEVSQARTADAKQPLLAEKKEGPVVQQDTAHGDRTAPATRDKTIAAFSYDSTQSSDGMAAWQEQSSLQIWFMLSGIITVMLNAVSLALNVLFSELALGFIVACVVVGIYTILAFIGLTLMVHKGWQHIQLRSKVKALCILAYTACAFCCVIAVLWLVVGVLQSIVGNLLAIGTFLLMLWHVYHAALSLIVASKAHHVKWLMDSASSGMLEV